MSKNNLFVLDTNLLISALLFSQSKSEITFETAVNTGALIASKETFAEFRKVLKRKKFDKYTSSK
jgi:predicted nucleic acid-binding protein